MTLLPFTEQNLILTGYIGPDQPHLGKKIAEQLRMPFFNVELEIAKRVNHPDIGHRKHLLTVRHRIKSQ